MTVDLEQISLAVYLKARDALYYGKVLELRQVVQDLLSYIPQTFPHYTRHTVPLEVTKLPASKVIGFAAHKTTDNVYAHGLLNEGHPFVQWLVKVRDCCAQSAHGLTKEQFERLIFLLETPVKQQGYELSRLTSYLDGWRNLPELPSELDPPAVELTRDMFVMKKESNDESSQRT